MKEHNRKCAKCGATPSEKSRTILHRFPKPGRTNSLRCELWAKYCFPQDPWNSTEFQVKLYSDHRMLCNKHFNKKYFIDDAGTKLVKCAVPDEESDKMSMNHDKEPVSPGTSHVSQPLTENINILNSNQAMNASNQVDPVEIVTVAAHPTLCRICLCSEIAMVEEVDLALIEFLEELLYYDTTEDSNNGMCKVCEHQLRRFYNFRQRCRRAHIVLKHTDMEPLELKKLQLPQLALGICNAQSNQIVIDIVVPDNDNSFENHKSHFDNSKRPVHIKRKDKLSHQIVGKGTKILQIVGKDAKSQQLVGQNTKYLQMVCKYAKSLQIVGKDAKSLQIVGKDAKNLQIVGKDTKSLKILGKYAKKLRKLGNGIAKNGRRLTLAQFKEKVTDLIDKGEFSDIEELGVKMSKEVFLNITEKHPQAVLARARVMKIRAGVPLIRNFLERILKTHNPIYDEVFDIKHLRTHEEKVAEFNSRQYSKAYIEAQNKCELCFMTFDAHGVLVVHQKGHAHNPNSRYVCAICQRRFIKRNNINDHYYANHTWVYQCKLCTYRAYKVIKMQEHYLSHKGITFNCDKCGRRFLNKSSLNNHVRKNHRHQRNCAHCGEIFNSLEKYSAHVVSKHADVDETTLPPPQFKCEKCCLFFYNCEALLKHEGKHREITSDDSVYPCFYCKERFDSPQALRQHKLTAQHSKINRAQAETRTCTLCHEDIDTSRPRAMYQHFKVVHPAAPFLAGRTLLCEQCGQAFAYMSEYNAHMRTHNGELVFECSECGERFSLRSVASAHVKQHAKDKRQRHMVNKEKVWQCHLCHKVLLHYANLKRHMLVHTGEKPYECSICLKRFSQSNSMKLHILTVHEGKKAPPRDRRGKRGHGIPKGGKIGLDNHSDRTEMNNDEEIENRGNEKRARLGQHMPELYRTEFERRIF